MEAWGVGRCAIGRWKVAAIAASMFSATIGGGLSPSGGIARAQEVAQKSFSIPPGPLSQALASFGKQAGLQVTYPSELTAGKQSSGVVGAATPQQALSKILGGSGLAYSFANAKTVVISGAAENAGATVEGAIPLDTIDVSGGAASGSGFQGTPDWVYETPSSVSVVSREAIKNASARNAREVLESVPGVWVNRSDIQNPGISVNVRGLYDNGRVATMVDGARQNFQRIGHYTSQRSYVDTAFIREVDIEKSGTSGVGSAGSLGGFVNFRTLEVGDVVDPGKQFGSEINLTTGTNEYHFDGSAALGFRISDRFAIVGGVAHKNVGEYKIGKNGELGPLAPTTPTFAGAETWSTFLKAEADVTEDMKLTLSWLRYQADASEGTLNPDSISYGESAQDIVNNTLSGTLHWDSDSDLIDLKASLWYNHLVNGDSYEGSNYFVPTQTDYRFATLGGSLENTSQFSPSIGAYAVGQLALNYGAEAFRDNGQSVASNSLINADPQKAAGYGGNNGSATRDVASGFANATLEHGDWLTVSGGLRYDWYQMKGDTTWYDQRQETVCTQYFWNDIVGIPTLPENDICTAYVNNNIITSFEEHVDHSGGELLPTAMVAVKPFDWLQPFIKYSHTFRPPTIGESLFSGGHPGGIGVEWAPNPDLRPETARTWEIGANVSRDGIFKADDKVRMKVVGFSRDVEDYILLGEFKRPEATRIYTSFLNVDGTTEMKGLEIEANYDAGFFYFGGSYTLLDIDWSNVEKLDTDGSLNGNSFFAPPGIKLTLDAGVRLFDEKLTLGGRMTSVVITQDDSTLISGFGYENYKVYDVYGSYEFDETATLRFAVNNVTDLACTPALGLVTHPAPGRTVTTSLNLKF
jgi:hemoglobin/transferrin/lactoferrin receptor protein